MACDNCTTAGETAFTLTTHVEGGERTVEADFCSIECLQAWTGGSTSFGEWLTESGVMADGTVERMADGGPIER